MSVNGAHVDARDRVPAGVRHPDGRATGHESMTIAHPEHGGRTLANPF
ncbi:hypothetical protein [Microbacterium sp. NPDC077184]